MAVVAAGTVTLLFSHINLSLCACVRVYLEAFDSMRERK